MEVQLRWYLADAEELFKGNSFTTMVTQSKLLTPAGTTAEVNVMPVRQLSQMGITENKRESSFRFSLFSFLIYFLLFNCSAVF